MKPALVLLCLLLNGCASKPAHPKVRIANPGTGFQTWSLPITLAGELGYYKEEGLDVEVENLGSAVKTMQALIGGSVDVAGIMYVQTIQIAAEAQQIRSFFVMTDLETKVLVVSPSAANRIHHIEDLKGAVIGTPSPGSSTHVWLNYIMSKHGLRPQDFSAIGIGVAAPAIAAVESGRVDAAAVGGGDHFYLLSRHRDLRILADVSTPEGMRETYGADTFAAGCVAAKPDWLTKNPDAARRLTRALQRTLHWIATHKAEEIREKLPEGFRSQFKAIDLDIIRWSLATYTKDGAMPRGAPQVVRRFLDATVENVRKANIDLAATWTNDFLPEAK